jgi:glutamyl-tRNA synthetase, bacterial family
MDLDVNINNELAELLYPHITTLPEDMERRYPPRNLPESAKVTRFAPSPTGFIHLGNIYGALIDERLAHQSSGVLFLRIEDTDFKREVKGGTALIIDMLGLYGIHFDEGATKDGDNGLYGPYRQSKRKEIYQTYAKQLVREGKAYPCFCTPEELSKIREEQTASKLTPGYYGKWAIWRDADPEQIGAKLAEGLPFVLRLRSDGIEGKSSKFTDLIKGTIDVTDNFIDHVILKSDGIPDYHFAHAVDDHLMRTTHVVRDESWLPSLPFHIELFRALGFKMPKYIHTAQVLKLDDKTGKKRKLSKRKDPEFGLSFFYKSGYLVPVTTEYLMTLLNSNYEEWRAQNPDKKYTDFPFSIKKLSPSGCLFDFAKLDDIGRSVISRMTSDEVYGGVTAWSKEYDKELYGALSADPDYAKKIFAVGRGGNKPRKDLAKWSDVKPYVSFFYDGFFSVEDKIEERFAVEDVMTALSRFLETYDGDDDQTAWFDKLKAIASELGFAPEVKQYKQSPEQYKGHVGDIAMFLRVAVTGRLNSPDLYEVMRIMGRQRAAARVQNYINLLKI